MRTRSRSRCFYHEYYKCFDIMPIAFADIEMIFDEERQAIDWIFRYGNEALARLEEVPLDKMIGSTFRSIFPNMDKKWLRSYERTVLYGETLELIDFSPEIDKYLRIICSRPLRDTAAVCCLTLLKREYRTKQQLVKRQL